MGISTLSFDKSRIYKNKMFFTQYGKNSVCTTILDNAGNHLISKISNRPQKSLKGDCVIISHKNEYEFPDKSIIFEYIERIYDKAGVLLKVNKSVKQQK